MARQKLFNEKGDREVSKRRIINGNSTRINDFNNVRYSWAVGNKGWYRNSMNNFWIPETVNMAQDVKDYRWLKKNSPALATAYEKSLSFVVYLDSILTHNLPEINEHITAPEVNLCLSLHTADEAIHSQSYAYILDSVASPEERDRILYQWADDEHLLKRNKFIGDLFEEFQDIQDAIAEYEILKKHAIEVPNVVHYTQDDLDFALVRTCMANFILEGIYFYSAFLMFYNFGRMGLLPGTVQEIQYINRDEETHLWLFINIMREIRAENPQLFTPERVEILKGMIREAVVHEVAWGQYVLGDTIEGITPKVLEKFIKYQANVRCKQIGFDPLYPEITKNPVSWFDQYADVNGTKSDFFESHPRAYSNVASVEDDL